MQGFVVLLLLMVAIMALIYGLKYQEDVRRGKPKNDDDDRWWGRCRSRGFLTEFRFWHQADMRTMLSDFRFRGMKRT